MSQDTLLSLVKRKRTQWVSVSDAAHLLAEANSLSAEQAGGAFVALDLPSLRPILVSIPPKETILEDEKNQRFEEAIICGLGGASYKDLSYEDQGIFNLYDFAWSIPTLIDWCRLRKLSIPTEWAEWMRSVYPNLLERDLVQKSTSWVSPTYESASTNSFNLAGDHWTITYQSQTAVFRNTLGMRYIAYLVQHQGEEILVSDLYYAINPREAGIADPVHSQMTEAQLAEMGLSVGDLGDAGEVLTPEGKEFLEAELLKIRDRIDDAIECGDQEKREELETKQEAVLQHIASQTGLSGKTRKASSAIEKIRVSVTKRIKADIKKISKTSPDLGRHLDHAIHTGTHCQYSPYPRVHWLLSSPERLS